MKDTRIKILPRGVYLLYCIWQHTNSHCEASLRYKNVMNNEPISLKWYHIWYGKSTILIGNHRCWLSESWTQVDSGEDRDWVVRLEIAPTTFGCVIKFFGGKTVLIKIEGCLLDVIWLISQYLAKARNAFEINQVCTQIDSNIKKNVKWFDDLIFGVKYGIIFSSKTVELLEH